LDGFIVKPPEWDAPQDRAPRIFNIDGGILLEPQDSDNMVHMPLPGGWRGSAMAPPEQAYGNLGTGDPQLFGSATAVLGSCAHEPEIP